MKFDKTFYTNLTENAKQHAQEGFYYFYSEAIKYDLQDTKEFFDNIVMNRNDELLKDFINIDDDSYNKIRIIWANVYLIQIKILRLKEIG